MSLRKALEGLPHDRVAEAATRDVISLFTRRPGEWLAEAEVERVIASSADIVERVLAVLTDSLVLDSRDGPLMYRYRPETLIELEVDRYLRRVSVHDDVVRSNVARFRERYTTR